MGVQVEFTDQLGKPLREPGTGRRLVALSENARSCFVYLAYSLLEEVSEIDLSEEVFRY